MFHRLLQLLLAFPTLMNDGLCQNAEAEHCCHRMGATQKRRVGAQWCGDTHWILSP